MFLTHLLNPIIDMKNQYVSAQKRRNIGPEMLSSE